MSSNSTKRLLKVIVKILKFAASQIELYIKEEEEKEQGK